MRVTRCWLGQSRPHQSGIEEARKTGWEVRMRVELGEALWYDCAFDVQNCGNYFQDGACITPTYTTLYDNERETLTHTHTKCRVTCGYLPPYFLTSTLLLIHTYQSISYIKSFYFAVISKTGTPTSFLYMLKHVWLTNRIYNTWMVRWTKVKHWGN